MNPYADATPIQLTEGLFSLFGDSGVFCEEETSLPRLAEEPVLVNPSVIRTYQRIIFQLESQVCRYKTLLGQLSRKSESPAEMVEMSTPVNEASVLILNSILQARIPEQNILRAFDEEEI